MEREEQEWVPVLAALLGYEPHELPLLHLNPREGKCVNASTKAVLPWAPQSCQEAWELLEQRGLLPPGWFDSSRRFICTRCGGGGTDPDNCPCLCGRGCAYAEDDQTLCCGFWPDQMALLASVAGQARTMHTAELLLREHGYTATPRWRLNTAEEMKLKIESPGLSASLVSLGYYLAETVPLTLTGIHTSVFGSVVRVTTTAHFK